ncbi:MAG TPA: cytochrome ubiquinol oxidase subunit I [Candidatus Avipropionibacterium avicola]|uniref:Cytochrome ubiquinol oxidase subunit I n=1 Tax=Candidatus Avipropionibacterium avicola TaxID=2840701 RepID=A0A9D1H0N1_9ACTN|nr:cytochrome ubiquinol oxidase subunit I [Candidatus Avipropionibacterium avicola]
MSVETLSRWQFGITTVYHFFFVPITIGMSVLVAIMQTLWVRTNNERYLKLTKFYGKLFLINFALGVATGIVQEFQFGMNWSEYSRFVGDIFGAPLALEGLLAFFLESTFLGLWIFGWDRIPRKLHLMAIWLAAIGTWLSAIFILAANSWMQNPVGFTVNAERGRAELTDFGAVLTNPVLLVTFPHQIMACLMTAGALVAAIAGWHMWRIARADRDSSPEQVEEVATHRWALRFGAVVMLIAGLGVVISGDLQGKVMYEVQPMKMAAAEALYESESPAAFSLFTIGTLDGSEEIFSVKATHILSFLATGTLDGEVVGINPLNEEYRELYHAQLAEIYGPEVVDQMPAFNPNIAVTYWSFRAMMGLGIACMLIGLAALWFTRKGKLPPTSRLWLPLMVAFPLAPLLANSFGWIFTEMGRQPWLVFGLMPTFTGVSPGTSMADIIISLSVFTVIYGVLGVIEVRLLLKYIRAGLPDVSAAEPSGDSEDEPLSFAY